MGKLDEFYSRNKFLASAVISGSRGRNMPSNSGSGDSIGILPTNCKPVKRTTSQQSQSADQPVLKKKKIVIRPRGGAVADEDGGQTADAPTREPSVDLVIFKYFHDDDEK
jgi:hypothetical protein